MISVFIPTYNGKQYVAKTIESVLAQTYQDFEIVCVDDLSTDTTFEILTSCADKDTRIRVFQKQHDGDVPRSWNYALPYLKGDFVIYMSQDDMLAPDALEKMIIRQKETCADAVLPVVVYYEENKPIEDVHCYKGVNGDLSQILTGKEAFELMLDYNISGFALWKTDIIKSVGMRIEAYNSDELAQREWVAHCKKVAFSDACFYYRRDNPNAITRTFATRNLYRSITEARLLELAIHYQLDADVIQNHRNEYYKNLWWNVMYAMLHKQSIAEDEMERLKSSFSEAYRILHHGVTLLKWYYRLGSLNEYLFWITVYIKLFIAKSKSAQ